MTDHEHLSILEDNTHQGPFHVNLLNSSMLAWHGKVYHQTCGQHRLTSKTSLHGHTFSLELLLLAKNMINHRVCHCE